MLAKNGILSAKWSLFTVLHMAINMERKISILLHVLHKQPHSPRVHVCGQ